MAHSPTTEALDRELKNCLEYFDRTIERAEVVLENRRNEHRRLISESESRVAALESQLELADAFERERDAARIRKELAAAVDQHRAAVDSANRQLAGWLLDHLRSYASAGICMEASFNAATARLSISN